MILRERLFSGLPRGLTLNLNDFTGKAVFIAKISRARQFSCKISRFPGCRPRFRIFQASRAKILQARPISKPPGPRFRGKAVFSGPRFCGQGRFPGLQGQDFPRFRGQGLFQAKISRARLQGQDFVGKTVFQASRAKISQQFASILTAKKFHELYSNPLVSP